MLAALTTAERLEPERLLVAVGWRDNEVGETHPAALWLNSLEPRCTMSVKRIRLAPLSATATAELVADSLQMDIADETLMRLAQQVHHKTEGVPFLVIQLLHSLHRSGAVLLSTSGRPVVDLEMVAAHAVSPGITSLIVPRILALPLATQHLLAIASCIGPSFRCGGVRSPDSLAIGTDAPARAQHKRHSGARQGVGGGGAARHIARGGRGSRVPPQPRFLSQP
jgi:predicted ATPase